MYSKSATLASSLDNSQANHSPRSTQHNLRATRQNQIMTTLLIGSLMIVVILGSFQPTTAVQSIAEHKRVKRALYELPDGAELIVGPNMRTSFSCDGLGYGYYADMDNDCKIFHICQSFKMSDGSIYNNHWSFMCANQTVFNQVSLACSHPEDAVPCENAKEFYYVNDYFGDLQAPSVKDTDLSAAHELVARAYGSRLTASTGANGNN